MAHELDTNRATGRKAMFSVRETPWHGEGFTIDTPPSFDEAMKLAGADYEVALKPLFIKDYMNAAAGSSFIESPTGRAVVRTDRFHQVLGVVGDDYELVQNREAFEILEPLVDQGVAQIETGGTLREGRDAWMLVRFKIDDPVVREVFADEVVPFAAVATNHTGLRRTMLMETPVRIVCANTLTSALKEGVSTTIGVAHKSQARVRLVEAAEQMFGKITERYVRIAEQYSALKDRILTVEEFTSSVLDVVAAEPRTKDGALATSGAFVERCALKRRSLFDLWERGAGHKGDHSRPTTARSSSSTSTRSW